MASPINTFTTVLFVLTASLCTFSIMYTHYLKNSIQYGNTLQPQYVAKTLGVSKNIGEHDRVQFISRCNMVNQELESLLSNQLVAVNDNHKQILIEKKHYINSIKDIVNDLSFNNRQHFEQLHAILKDIHNDVVNQNKRIVVLEQKVSNDDKSKNELANMLIQRMVNDSSKKVLKKSQLSRLLEKEGEGDKDEELKVLEKYIIKTIRAQLKKEMNTNVVQSQGLGIGINNELERKLELMDLVNHKLRTMENLYRNLHSPNKKQIITVIKEPVQKSIKPYVSVPNAQRKNIPKCSTKSKKHSIKINRKPDEANTYYVTDDE
jgi:hypothetical protein